jgi:hypothetical protein
VIKQMNIFGKPIGTWKVIADRTMNYMSRAVTLINFILLINISSLLGSDMMQYAGIGMLLGIGGLVFMIFDIIVIFPGENNYLSRNNPMLLSMEKDIKEINERMKNAR